MAYSIPAPAPLDMNMSNLAASWERFSQRYNNFAIATGVNAKEEATQVATLLSIIGNDGLDTYNAFSWAAEGDKLKIETVINKFEAFCSPKKNAVYERYVFNTRSRKEQEPIDAYATNLRLLADTCEYGELRDSLIRDNIILNGTRDKHMKQRLINMEQIDLARTIAEIRASETARLQVKTIEKQPAEHAHHACAVEHGRNQHRRNQHKNMNKSKPPDSNQPAGTCYLCGNAYPHTGDCPAKGKKCSACGTLNHFAKVCRKAKKQHQNKGNRASAVQESSDTDDSSSEEGDYTFPIKSPDDCKQPRVNIQLQDSRLNVMIDTGTAKNIMSENTFQNLHLTPKLNRDTEARPLYGYGSEHALNVLGTFTADTTYNDVTVQSKWHVVKGGTDTLLSFGTSKSLGLVEISYSIDTTINCSANSTSDNLLSEYEDRFTGIGKLKDADCMLHIDTTVQPVAQTHRRIPFHMRKKVAAELNRLQELDIIEPVDNQPTPWISPLRAVNKPKKPGEIRICVDMRAPNKAIERERHVTPTIDDIITRVNGAVMFSKLDMNSGYHQVELAPESRYITVFSSHIGLFRYKRLNFGVCSAAEKFQNLIQSALVGLSGVINVSDDILIFGTTENEHAANLRACLDRMRAKNLTLNRGKCELFQRRIEFYGHVFTEKGVEPDPQKVIAIANAAPPQDKEELHSLLGMVNYCARFIADLATLTDPLRQLIKSDATWNWTESHQNALQLIKDKLSAAGAMSYYDPQKTTEIIVDASPVGLGAILVQHGTHDQSSSIVAYASKSLSPTEQRYSQIEREALAVTWGIQHFRLYAYGSDNVITITTDHKPLIPLFNNTTAKPPLRIERWLLRIQEYHYTVRYEPGKNNPADYLSRHPPCMSTGQPASASQTSADAYVNMVTFNAIPKSISLEEIQKASQTDMVIQACMTAVTTGNWHHARQQIAPPNQQEFDSYFHIREELTVNAEYGILLRDHRIAIPRELRQRTINIAHEGHQGIVKTKQLLREKVWFPKIDQMVETTVEKCIPCQISTPERSTKEPIKMTELPKSPWEQVSIDFKELPTGDYLLVVVDDYSRYPEIDIVSSTSAKSVIPKLDRIFATFGSPQVVRTDNGPPFNSSDFASFALYIGFHHRKITPLWPQANGEVERMMRNLKKVYRTATTENQPWKQAVYTYLRNYRATPHSTTGVAPATLLFQYGYRTRLPEISHKTSSHDKDVRPKDKKEKDRMKRNAEQSRSLRKTKFKIGDIVLVKRTGYISNSLRAISPTHLPRIARTPTRSP